MAAPPGQLPWRFTVDFYCDEDSHVLSSKLYDPISIKTHTIKDQSWLKDTTTCHGSRYDSIQVWASKGVWLLIYISADELTKPTTSLLYNPFTNKRIQLPTLNSMFDCATFSSSPTSSDCMVFVMEYDYLTEIACIHTWYPGEPGWIPINFHITESPVRDTVFSKEVLYCLNYDYRIVAAFNLHRNASSRIDLPEFDKFLEYDRVHLVESNSEIMLVCVHDPGYDTLILEFHVFKLVLDPSISMSWVRVEGLGNRAAVISHNHSVSIEVSEKSTKLGGIEEGVYYLKASSLFYSSLKEKSFASYIYSSLGGPKYVNLIKGLVEPPAVC